MPAKFLNRNAFRKIGQVLLFLFLLVLPLLVRAGYYYRGLYVPAYVPRPDHAAVDVPTVERISFQDLDVRRGKGQVAIDRAHDNAVYNSDLNVLLARLTARGMESVSITADDSWSDMLRDATALIVISPHRSFSVEEIQAVGQFVRRGGRVLLIADPGRYTWVSEFADAYGEYMVLDSDVAAINSLASQFGLAFSDDYVYNTNKNAGNYQYVILTDWSDSPLTAGLEKVIFYAAHSIASGQKTLITADEHTTSSLSEQTGDLVVMSLGGNGQVLAMSDFTFMTEPYNSTADNNQLIANIAAFVASARRVYGLRDFPLFLADCVAVVPLLDPSDSTALSADAVQQLAVLKSALEETGRDLRWQIRGDEGDIIYAGLYGNVAFWPEVSEILSSQCISFTLETVERQRAAPTPSLDADHSPRPPTPTPRSSPTPTPTERPLRDWIHFHGIGQVEAKELALIYRNLQGDHQVLVVLAFDEQGLQDAAKRLISGDLDDCLLDEDLEDDPGIFGLALCPVSYREAEVEPTLTPTFLPTPDVVGSILIVADNDGQGIYDWWTSADDFAEVASEAGYEVTIWSTFLEGDVTLEQLRSFDGVIWCTGDYQEPDSTPREDDLDVILSYLDEGGRLILSGGFIGSTEDSEKGSLLDIQVAQASHPLAEGFEAEQIIALEQLTNEQDYAFFTLAEADPELIVFVRGPSSEFAGEAIITASEDESFHNRALIIGFPIYLLPDEERHQLATNAVLWLMAGLEG
jgi:hypothetical protein